MSPKVISNLLSVEALLREMKRLDNTIEDSKAKIKQAKIDKAKLNKVIALIEQMYPSNVALMTTPPQPTKKCPTCGEKFTPKGLGVHIRMKHKGGAMAANKAATASRKRAAR